jgi:fructokinase
MAPFGTVELGGTKTLVATGTTPDDLTSPRRIPTEDPETTLGLVVEQLAGEAIEAVGVASFGPIELRPDHPGYGSITRTPKPGWSGTPVLRELTDALGLPVGLDTDVNGSALGEGRWGAAEGLSDFVYLTVGTGIGGGAIAGGSVLGGVSHPEMGHTVVEPHPDDRYPGRCPYHGGCLEGMASGPALEDRFGPVGEWAGESEAMALAVHYLAQVLRNIVYTMAPQRVIVGGGVSSMTGFHEHLRAALASQLQGYPGLLEFTAADYLVAPGLGDRSGLAGGLVLAARALG